MRIEQALYGAHGIGDYRCLARSPGFLDAWLPAAERLCVGFGDRPAGVACPACVFAQPFEGRFVAVVQAADRGPDALGFRLLVVPADLYRAVGGDPFYLADQYPPPWQEGRDAELPALEWTAPPPSRGVEDLQKVLNVPGSATLLGGAQALLDGSRLVFRRPAPDAELLRSLWALLPTNSRCEMWPASFAFGNGERYHAVVVPEVVAWDVGASHFLDEQQAGDYPEGRYELELQSAVEAGDQRATDALLARRSRPQMIRLALGLLAVMVFVPFLVLLWPSEPPRAMAPPAPAERPHQSGGGANDEAGPARP